MELAFVIPLNPASKKNSQQIVYPKGRKPIVVQNEIYKKYEKACKKWCEGLVDEPISVPVNIEAVFYRKDRRRVDLTNLLAALSDILVKYGVLADDNRNIVYSVNNSKVLYDKIAPRTEIRITDVPEGEFEEW